MAKVYMHLEMLVPLKADNAEEVNEDWQELLIDDEPPRIMIHGPVEVPEDLEEAVTGLAQALAALIENAENSAEVDMLASIPDDQIPHA